MDGHVDETSHVMFLGKFENNKRYKEKIIQEIIVAICAMLNSNGGKVVIYIDTDSNDIPVEGSPFSQMSLVIRILEQSMQSFIGLNQTVSKIHFKEDKESIVIIVEKADSLITTSYNLYLPSETQVVLMPPLEPLEKVKDDIINRRVVPEPVQRGSYCQTFRKGKNCGFHEDKMHQVKCLKADQSKRTTLADRITGNKFSSYVSAFANYSGGHMYYGITDDEVVEGELIPNEKSKNEITKKVDKAINKMIWPEDIGQPTRHIQWDIFFEPVLDENSKSIPSTFVVVIYIAPCLGGVFTEEPECYGMVEGKVKKMSFATWRERILVPVEIESVPHAIGSSITWISKRTEKRCIQAFSILTLCLNNGDLKEFQEKSKEIKERFPDIVELKLVVLLKEILARSRKHHFNTADGLLEEYNSLLSNAAEHRIFEVLGLYVQAAYNRPKCNEGETLTRIRDILVSALAKSEWLIPGLVTALVYLFAGTMTDRFKDPCLYPPDVLSHNALQHLEQVMSDYPEVRADLEYKAHITLATFHLGCNLSGELVAEHVDDNCLNQANSSIMAIEQSIGRDNRKLTHYREVQLNLVKSISCFRYSQNQIEKRMHFMQKAFEFSKNGENLAGKWKFYEMVLCSRSLQGLFTENLVRAKFQ